MSCVVIIISGKFQADLWPKKITSPSHPFFFTFSDALVIISSLFCQTPFAGLLLRQGDLCLLVFSPRLLTVALCTAKDDVYGRVHASSASGTCSLLST